MEAALNKKKTVEDSLNYTITSWSKQKGINPLLIDKAQGVFFYDSDGNKYLDFSSQLICSNIGHGHPAILEAVTKQMNEVSYVYPGLVTKIRGDIGKKLSGITPGDLNRTFFTLGGAEAIENAIKLARLYTGRHKIIALYQSYHGATYGAFSAGGDPRKLHVDSQQVPNFIHIENPYYYRCPWNSKSPEECAMFAAMNLERVINYEGPNNIAAIILEGESGSSGVIKYPANYLKLVKEIISKYGILYIDDEVMSGFGRTGKWFGVDHHNIEPDIMCVAKGLTSAYLPLGGVIISEKIASAFDDKVLPLGLTYSAHPVSLAAALAVLKVYEDENLIENAAVMGEYIDSRVEEMKEIHPSIGDFRNRGLLGCLELVKNRETKEPMAPWNSPPDKMQVMNKINAKLMEMGLYTIVRWNYVFIAPPLCINKELIDEGLEKISEALKIADKETY
jgi:taurine---2-oxoglutarate transaminase